MRHVMAVYDVDPFYAARLAEVVNQREKIPFEMVAFASLERLRLFVEENKVELLLISSQVNREEVEKLGIERVITLSDGEPLQAEKEYPSIYKYQSSDSLIREVMACYCEEKKEELTVVGGAKASVIGVYSPVGRCLKTSFAIAMGQLMSQEGKTLYLTLEGYSGLSALTHEAYSQGLSDLMYFYSQETFNTLRLNSVIHCVGGLDYIPPVRYPEDLEQLDGTQMAGLIGRIARESIYERVIVDVGSYGRQLMPLLDICSVIYMPVKEDSMSSAKISEFYEHLEQSGNTEIKEKIKKLKLPFHSSFGKKERYLEQLLWGELGDYVRQLLRGGLKR